MFPRVKSPPLQILHCRIKRSRWDPPDRPRNNSTRRPIHLHLRRHNPYIRTNPNIQRTASDDVANIRILNPGFGQHGNCDGLDFFAGIR
ncbi:hypothetical protein BST61_g8427 [Cercospora zeina]